MNDNLKKYIITIILNKDNEDINEEKYAEVIKALSINNHIDDICSYIMRCASCKIMRDKLMPTDTNILNLITTKFCVNNAYDYLLFLQNDHEPSHESEKFIL